MISRAIWKLILGLILLSISFFVGLGISSFEISDKTSSLNSSLLLLSFVYNVAVALSMTVIIVSYLAEKTNIKNAFTFIIIFLILLPLAFWGSCMLTFSGHYLRSLFIK
jgi:hypothetical protein